MKAITKIAAIVLSAAALVTAAGCGGAPKTAKTATSANWNVRTSALAENSFAERWLNNKEVATYSIAAEEGTNPTYSVAYAEGGTYTTEFYMTEYNWSTFPPEELQVVSQTDDGTEEQAAPSQVKEKVYVYKTLLQDSVTFTHTASKQTKTVEEKVETVCYYRLAGKNLQPVYSAQTIKNAAPNILSADSLDATYVEMDREYKTYYNYDCSEATVISKDNLADDKSEKTKKVSLTSKEGYSVFDNSQIRAAARAFTLTGGSTHTFNSLVAQDGIMQLCYATCTEPVKMDGENQTHAQIISALQQAEEQGYLFFDATTAEGEDARNYRFTAVSFSIDEDMRGTTPVCWYSSVENNDVNTTRAALLRISLPLPFLLGGINYTLKSLSFVPIQ